MFMAFVGQTFAQAEHPVQRSFSNQIFMRSLPFHIGADHAGRNAGYRGSRRYILRNNRARSNDCAIADLDDLQNE